VRQRMGVVPRQVVDAMALTGDSSDNIPGVRGVGPRAAVALLEAFEDLEGIYADLGRVEGLALRGAGAGAEAGGGARGGVFGAASGASV
jgi:DNA polymerase-1